MLASFFENSPICMDNDRRMRAEQPCLEPFGPSGTDAFRRNLHLAETVVLLQQLAHVADEPVAVERSIVAVAVLLLLVIVDVAVVGIGNGDNLRLWQEIHINVNIQLDFKSKGNMRFVSEC